MHQLLNFNKRQLLETEQDYVGPEESSLAAIEAAIREVTGMSDNGSPNKDPENNDLLSKQQIFTEQ